ncbi:MAG: ABC transporter permease [Bryobacterales bacterium]|nr:ABC transporter permease [Bryobacterales bacterium]
MWRRLRYWLRIAERERLLREEMDVHLAMLADEFQEDGMSRKDAEAAARRQFGSGIRFGEDSRQMWIARWAGDLAQDVLYAGRSLRRQPGLAVVAALSSGLGIAACALIFGVANHALLRTLPVEEPSCAVSLYGKNIVRGKSGQSLSYPDVEDLREARSLRGIAIFSLTPGTVAAAGDPQRYWGMVVSANYFDVARPGFTIGRGFDSATDDRPGGAPVVVLSYSLWQARFAGDRQLVGKPAVINGRKMTVIGVTKPGFRGTEAMLYADFWVPLSQEQAMGGFSANKHDRGSQWLMATARLQDGVSLAEASAEVEGIGLRLSSAYPETNKDRRFDLQVAGRVNPGARVMLGVFFLMLLIVAGLVHLTSCANVANMLLARSSARRREIATRLAIGAGRGRLVRQLLTESVLLALPGGLLGYVLAHWGVATLSLAQLPFSAPIDLTLALDTRAMLFAAILSVATGVVFGLAPALSATKMSLVGGLKEEAEWFGKSRRFTLRNALVVAQVAVCTVLLVCSGLFLRSVSAAYRIDLGFERNNLLLASFDPSLHGYTPPMAEALVDRIVASVEALPGVRSVALGSTVPLNLEGTQNAFEPETEDGGEGARAHAEIYSVSHGYFDTLGIRFLQGEDFPRGAPSEDIVIVNRTLAGRAFAGGNALGRYLRYQGRRLRIAAVVADSKSRTIGEDARNCLYFPIAREMRGSTMSGMTLLVRTAGEPLAFAATVREQIRRIDQAVAVFQVRSMEQQVERALTMARLTAWLFGLAGAIGVVIAAAGLTGVIGFSVARRTKEIGIRMALGARPGLVLLSILREGLLLTSLGAAAGLALAAALARMAAGFLYGISSTDSLTFIAAPLLLLSIALSACYLPARRAAQLDPLRALRHE